MRAGNGSKSVNIDDVNLASEHAASALAATGVTGPRIPGIGPADVCLAGRRLAALAALLAVWSPPGAVSVLDGERLAARHVTDIEDLSYALPNVAFDGIGTGKGIANFSIRSAGVAGSIRSIDPTVGVFVDGMYLGVNYGVIMDLMDLEAIEVLRGPQGLLFGRNVTGGRAAEATVRLETGPEKRASGAVEGAFANGTVHARLAASYRDDAGWFDNDAPGGGSVGMETSSAVRPVVSFRSTDDLDVTIIVERGESDGDGPATQNRYRDPLSKPPGLMMVERMAEGKNHHLVDEWAHLWP